MKYQKNITYLLFLIALLMCSACTKKQKSVLIFSKTAEFRHSSIEQGVVALTKLMESEKIKVQATEDASLFAEESLKQYAAVIFLSTTGDVLNDTQQIDFQRYIQAGGGFVGIHAATDTEYDWPWYNNLVGAYFNGHPAIQDATLKTVDRTDPCCSHLPDTWTLNEEWYNFKSINPDIEVLMEIDESSYEGGNHGEKHPMVWRHHYDGGRSFYTAIGHKVETFAEPLYLKQVLAGIEFAIGDRALDYSKCTTARIP